MLFTETYYVYVWFYSPQSIVTEGATGLSDGWGLRKSSECFTLMIKATNYIFILITFTNMYLFNPQTQMPRRTNSGITMIVINGNV